MSAQAKAKADCGADLAEGGLNKASTDSKGSKVVPHPSVPRRGKQPRLSEVKRLRNQLDDRGSDLACVAREACYIMQRAARSLFDDGVEVNPKISLHTITLVWSDILKAAGEDLERAILDFQRERGPRDGDWRASGDDLTELGEA